ncbi:hypothetical protein AHiyo6_34700, partial [Arthrobacter sp. Hiyo6]
PPAHHTVAGGSETQPGFGPKIAAAGQENSHTGQSASLQSWSAGTGKNSRGS